MVFFSVANGGVAGGGDYVAAVFNQSDISTSRRNGLTALLSLYILKALELVREGQSELAVISNVAELQMGMLIRSFHHSRKRWISRDSCGCASSLNT